MPLQNEIPYTKIIMICIFSFLLILGLVFWIFKKLSDRLKTERGSTKEDIIEYWERQFKKHGITHYTKLKDSISATRYSKKNDILKDIIIYRNYLGNATASYYQTGGAAHNQSPQTALERYIKDD